MCELRSSSLVSRAFSLVKKNVWMSVYIFKCELYKSEIGKNKNKEGSQAFDARKHLPLRNRIAILIW